MKKFRKNKWFRQRCSKLKYNLVFLSSKTTWEPCKWINWQVSLKFRTSNSKDQWTNRAFQIRLTNKINRKDLWLRCTVVEGEPFKIGTNSPKIQFKSLSKNLIRTKIPILLSWNSPMISIKIMDLVLKESD